MNRRDITLGSLWQSFRTKVGRGVVSRGCCWSWENIDRWRWQRQPAGNAVRTLKKTLKTSLNLWSWVKKYKPRTVREITRETGIHRSIISVSNYYSQRPASQLKCFKKRRARLRWLLTMRSVELMLVYMHIWWTQGAQVPVSHLAKI